MQRRILAAAALATLAAAGPITATDAATKAKASRGVVYGAVTSQGYPVVVELSKTGRKVVSASIGLEVKCQMPPDITLPDSFTNMTISKSGSFHASIPVTRLPAEPEAGLGALDISASITGRVNKARTRVTGTWQRTIVIYDASDPTATKVFDTCDSGPLRFRAKQ
jgi:hypothetical protein